jgi:hypothetical protein
MAGVVHIPFYATVFRGDRLAEAVTEFAPVTIRYGASSYGVHRNLDDRYKILMFAAFEHKRDWDRFWHGPEAIRFRAVNQSYYQVPLLYSWNDVLVEGFLDAERQRALGVAPEESAVGDVL